MIENKRTRQARGSVVARCAVIAFLVLGTRAMAIVTVKVATDSGARGGALHLTLSIAREIGDGSLASLNTDVIFDTAQLDLVGTCASSAACRISADCGPGDFCRFASPTCEKDPRLTDQTVEIIPPDFQNVLPGKRRVRFAIVATKLPVPTFSDGPLVTCTFQIPASAPIGPVTLATGVCSTSSSRSSEACIRNQDCLDGPCLDRLQVADNSIPAKPVAAQQVIEAGQIFGAVTPSATVSVQATATPTVGGPSATATGATPTQTPVTPSGGSPTPTGGMPPCVLRPAPSGPAIYVGDHLLGAGAPVTTNATVKLATAGAQVAGTQNDLVFDPNIRIKAKESGKPDCTANPDINKSGTSFGFRPPGCSGAACTGVRALVLATDNTDPIPDGSVLYTCNVVLSATAILGNAGVIFSDPNGQRIEGATGREGIFCIGGISTTPTVTPTVEQACGNTGATCTSTPTSTRTPTHTPTIGEHGCGNTGATCTSTPRSTPTPTMGEHACGTSGAPCTSTPTLTGTPLSTPNGGNNGGGGGCNCRIDSLDPGRGGWSSFWLLAPAALLLWRRRSRC